MNSFYNNKNIKTQFLTSVSAIALLLSSNALANSAQSGSASSGGSSSDPEMPPSTTASSSGGSSEGSSSGSSNGPSASDILLNLSSAGATQRSLNIVEQILNSGNVDPASFGTLLPQVDNNRAAEAINRITTPSVTNGVQTSHISSVTNNVQSRINDIGGSSEQEGTGVSSGSEDLASKDNDPRPSAWLKGFGSAGLQKRVSSDSGYKVTSYGVSLGADTDVSDNSLIGGAISYINSGLKFKELKEGDTLKTNGVMFSLYGKLDLVKDFYLKAITSFGSNSVKQSSKRVISQDQYDNAIAKYTSMSYSIELDAVYRADLGDGLIASPLAGLRYIRFGNSSYRESGSQYNMRVTQSSYDQATALVGMGIETKLNLDKNIVRLESHANIGYDFKSQMPKISSTLSGFSTSFDSVQSNKNKLSLNIGAKASLNKGPVDYGIGYDFDMMKKYMSHTGSLQVKISL